jgi:hypothetical protein
LGYKEYGPGEFLIHDDLPVGLSYVEGSLQYSSTAGVSWVKLDNDNAGDTIYQLDEAGLPSRERLLAHGGVRVIRYKTLVHDPVEVVEYNNEAAVSFPNQEGPLARSGKEDKAYVRSEHQHDGWRFGWQRKRLRTSGGHRDGHTWHRSDLVYHSEKHWQATSDQCERDDSQPWNQAW